MARRAAGSAFSNLAAARVPGVETKRDGSGRTWTFLSNHGHILVALSRNPNARIRDLAAEVGITERAAQAIVNDLEADGYITKVRVGRRNEYRLHPELHFRHPAESERAIGSLLEIFRNPA